MSDARSKIRTEIGSTSVDRITVRGRDLATELLGKIDFIDMILLTHSGRMASAGEKDVINAILVAVTDHGFTPSTIAARLTYMGAPEAPQAAVAAGLLGAGSVFLGAMENAAHMLTAGAAQLNAESPADHVAQTAREMVSSARAERRALYGLGHPVHVDGDPRVPALREIADRNGFFGKHWRLMLALEAANRETARRPLPLNAAGAIAASVCDMGLPLDLARGFALIGRCAGLVAHLNEERQHPTGRALWDLVLRQDERNVLPQ
jgi:citrate synthase